MSLSTRDNDDAPGVWRCILKDLGAFFDLGQSIWLDYISRDLMRSGELARLMSLGVRGLTSNPTIFERALSETSEYDADIRRLAGEGLSAEAIYERLATQDLSDAADTLRPVWEASHGVDGYVSMEVAPAYSGDVASTVVEAWRLTGAIGRPNVMIKVPGTPEGMRAVERLVAKGRSVNVTLLFSLEQYEDAAEAYLKGLERFAAIGGNPATVASVASFFVSRIDTAVDRVLRSHGAMHLGGKAAVACAKTAYARHREIFRGTSWQRLVGLGARPQRLLWASTGTKHPAYSDTKYVDELVGPETVNTVPLGTLSAVLDRKSVV